MHRSPDIVIKSFKGRDISPHVDAIARFRISGFRSFPYLYEGSPEYEKEYLACYEREPDALLVCAYADGVLCGVATSLPLCSGSDIVAGAESLFRTHGRRPESFYYYAEIIVDPVMRGHGIARKIYAVRERHAHSLGLPNLCLAVVQREENHPLRPKTYVSPERIWKREGFVRTDMTFTYEWPTIQPDGNVAEENHLMRFWVRDSVDGIK